MLSILKISDKESTGFFGKLRTALFKPSVEAYMRCVTDTNIHYILICCEQGKRGIDWRMAAAHSLDHSNRVLLPIGVTCPKHAGVKRFQPYEFNRRMLENLAMDILVCSEKLPEKRSIALYGRENEILILLEKVIKLAGEVRIITRRRYAVEKQVEELTKRTGTPIMITGELDAGGADILLASSGGASVIKTLPDTIVIAPDRPMCQSRLWVRGYKIALPVQLECDYDPQYDLVEYVAAMYEIAGMRDLAGISPLCAVTEQGELKADEIKLA